MVREVLTFARNAGGMDFKTSFWPEQSISHDRVNAGLNGSRASGSLRAFFCFSLFVELAGHNPGSFSPFSHESSLYLPYILPTDCKEQDIHEEMSIRPLGQPPISNTPRGSHLCSANEAPRAEDTSPQGSILQLWIFTWSLAPDEMRSCRST